LIPFGMCHVVCVVVRNTTTKESIVARRRGGEGEGAVSTRLRGRIRRDGAGTPVAEPSASIGAIARGGVATEEDCADGDCEPAASSFTAASMVGLEGVDSDEAMREAVSVAVIHMLQRPWAQVCGISYYPRWAQRIFGWIWAPLPPSLILSPITVAHELSSTVYSASASRNAA
jgi:hypothetical protein